MLSAMSIPLEIFRTNDSRNFHNEYCSGKEPALGQEPTSEGYVTLCLPYKWIANDKSSLSRKMRWAGHVARMREKMNVYRISVGKARRKETTRKT
jgi:hypothetical protein